jgi:zinc D-Ala-D-Ala carboxypeptidase
VNLSANFTLEELTASKTAAQRGIDNSPSLGVLDNLRRLASLLEQVRTAVDRPIRVSSGYRCAALNRAVGGAPASAHMNGLAADISAPGLSPKQLATAIVAAGVAFDQLIYEGAWVHIGLASGGLRNQILTARFADGRVTYLEGIV